MYSYVGSYSISLFIFVLAMLKYNNNITTLCYNKTMNGCIPTLKPQQKSILLSLVDLGEESLNKHWKKELFNLTVASGMSCTQQSSTSKHIIRF